MYRCPAGVCKTEAKEAEETQRVHYLLLEERLDEERERLNELQDWFDGRGLWAKQREEEQGSDCPLAMAAEHQYELSIPSPIRSNQMKKNLPHILSQE